MHLTFKHKILVLRERKQKHWIFDLFGTFDPIFAFQESLWAQKDSDLRISVLVNFPPWIRLTSSVLVLLISSLSLQAVFQNSDCCHACGHWALCLAKSQGRGQRDSVPIPFYFGIHVNVKAKHDGMLQSLKLASFLPFPKELFLQHCSEIVFLPMQQVWGSMASGLFSTPLKEMLPP